MDVTKPEFKLECACGCNLFYISHTLDGDKYEIRCEDCDCGRVVGYVSRYGIDWVNKEKKDAVSAD